MSAARFLKLDSSRTGALLCIAALALVWSPQPLHGALALELLAASFWVWARGMPDASREIARWSWLRRTAALMWVAAGLEILAASPSNSPIAGVRALAGGLLWLRAAAVLAAGLELLAALPLSRVHFDRPGPLQGVGPWLPVILPSAGFVLLWRHAEMWAPVPAIRGVAVTLLLITAALAALRAFSRRRWMVSLRWLVVADCALAALLIAWAPWPPTWTLALWLGTCGGRTALLAGELAGSAPRRRPAVRTLWQIASWSGLAALSWPLMLAWLREGTTHAWMIGAVALTVGLEAWVTVRRLVEAPERRSLVRREAAVSITQVAAGLTLLIGPAALGLAWWQGYRAPWPLAILALLPALLGGALAWWADLGARTMVLARAPGLGAVARGAADRTFRTVVALERRVARVLGATARAVLTPIRDLHTGDAQEYLLFLAGVGVLALVLPLLR